MMRDDKLIELFESYAKLETPGRLGDAYALKHAAWMATQAIGFVREAQALEAEGRGEIAKTGYETGGKVLDPQGAAKLKAAQSKREKAHRWLGFIQGVLWMAGVYSLDELKEHSHKCSDDYNEVDAKDDAAAMDEDARRER